MGGESKIINFKVKPGRDDDLIDWMKTLGEGERSFHLRQTLRRGLRGNSKPSYRPKIDKGGNNDKPAEIKEINPNNNGNEEDIEAKLDAIDF